MSEQELNLAESLMDFDKKKFKKEQPEMYYALVSFYLAILRQNAERDRQGRLF